MNKLVSVIVPVYQSEQHLKRCLQSITGQTYLDLEIILVDDGSRDRSLAICREYAAQDQRINVYHQENQGVSSARNTGIQNMHGEFVMFVDADDYLDLCMIEDLMNAIEGTSADLAISGFKMVFEDGSPDLIYQTSATYTGSLKSFVKTQMLECYDKFLLNTQCNKLCSTEMIRKYDIRYLPDMAINEDIYISMQMVQHSRQIVCINKAYYHYWQYTRPQSLISRFNENGIETSLILLEVVWNCLKKAQADAVIRNEMNNRMLFHICGFAGLPYYRSMYSNRQCLQGVRDLSKNQIFRKLLKDMKAHGLKNRTAHFLLRFHLYFIYHGLCLLIYRKKRKEYRQMRD